MRQTLILPENIKEILNSRDLSDYEIGRVVIEHKERYIVRCENNTYNAEITGNLRYSAESRTDFPAVGDWVKMMKIDDESAVIIELLPRRGFIERQAVGAQGERQIIAANIDVAFIMQAAGQDFNLKRIERYLTICHTARIEPVILLSKIDLISEDEVNSMLRMTEERVKDITIICFSNETLVGLEKLKSMMESGKTYCVLGSSGVGKSTLINRLIGDDALQTKSISERTNKGRHTTSHRELFILPGGSIIIDTPGMRELGMTDQSAGIEQTYSEIEELAQNCKFKDCTHTSETGCAVLEALETEQISQSVFDNYHKLKREQEHFSSTVLERRQKDKEFGKMIKTVMSMKKNRRL